MSDDDSKAIVSLLRVLVADVAHLRSAIAGSRARTLSGADRSVLQKLLPCVFGALGDCTWSAADLFEHADLDVRFGADLRQLFGPKPNRKWLGKLLARAAGSVVDGLEVHRVVRLRAGVVWRVSARV